MFQIRCSLAENPEQKQYNKEVCVSVLSHIRWEAFVMSAKVLTRETGIQLFLVLDSFGAWALKLKTGGAL